MSHSTIPLVDLRDYADPALRARFVQVLGEGLEQLGFVAVTGHNVDRWLLERAYAAARRVFALPEEAKRKHEVLEAARQRGYTPFGTEIALGRALPDSKEFWQIGRELDPLHPYARAGLVPANRFPAEVPEFREIFLDYFSRVEGFALVLLDAIGEFLGLGAEFFRGMVRDGNTVLRVLNYPDPEGPPPPGSIRAAAHEDINLITVLPASTKPGLELMTRDGQWMGVTTPPDVLICDTGDMMQLVTAGTLPATRHRVVNPEGADGGRLSMPLFIHPRPDYLLSPLTPGWAQPILAHDFLQQRLDAIGVSGRAHAGGPEA